MGRMLTAEELDQRSDWPELPLSAWRDTYATLHMYTQVIGKVRLALSPKTNQWWNVPFYTTARGLTTSPIPYGARTFECTFDFIDHELRIETSEGARRSLALVPRTVADFYRDAFAMLRALDIEVRIREVPCEVPDPIPFSQDKVHASYEPDHAWRFWTIVRRLDILFKEFRARFRGKCSPVHFFWGSFDLAVTRFSGRVISPPENMDAIARDAYDEEVSSLGFWPGDATTGGAALYSYTVPAPPGFAEARVHPDEAFYSREKQEFILPYEAVRMAADPEAMVLAFAQSTYDAGATLGGWDRKALEYVKRTPREYRERTAELRA